MGVTYSAADYLAAMLALGHRGRAWPTEPGTIRSAVMTGLAQSYVRSGGRIVNLVTDAFPATTNELIPEWEKSLGLPDPCTALNPSTQQRAAAILAKFIGSGGQSTSYFISIAAALGFTITITEFRPFCADMPCDGPDYDPSWASAWQVNAPQVTTFYFSADQSSADDPLETYDNTELACRLQEYAPAQSVLLFNFS